MAPRFKKFFLRSPSILLFGLLLHPFLTAFIDEGSSSLPEGIQFIHSEKEAKELEMVSSSFMEKERIQKAYQSLLENAYDGDIPDFNDPEALIGYHQELLGVLLNIEGRKKASILPLDFMKSRKEAIVVRCFCDTCEEDHEAECAPVMENFEEGSGSYVCRTDTACNPSGLSYGKMKETVGLKDSYKDSLKKILDKEEGSSGKQ